MNWNKIIEAAIAGLIFTSAMIAIAAIVVAITVATLMTAEWLFYVVWFVIAAIFGRYWYKKMEES